MAKWRSRLLPHALSYVEKDERGVPMICRVQKPIYGVPQAGRRLQRCLFDWMLDASKAGLRQLDDSDHTIFIQRTWNY